MNSQTVQQQATPAIGLPDFGRRASDKWFAALAERVAQTQGIPFIPVPARSGSNSSLIAVRLKRSRRTKRQMLAAFAAARELVKKGYPEWTKRRSEARVRTLVRTKAV